MTAPSTARNYFTAGGTLHPSAPSYVARPADDELLRLTLQGVFCYVLTSRQRGKSSLMVRTVERLRKENVSAAVIDLSGLGTSQLSSEQWYVGMLKRLAERLRLPIDVTNWWEVRQALSAIQRFSEFFREVVLDTVEGRIVIFIDEIDSTLKLGFTDDFFAAIRGFYNARASDPAFERLSFVLLGVAAPTDLIKDRARTPFNIGTPIELQDLSIENAQPLIDGLELIAPDRGKQVLERVFAWTGGHPYLTQKICLAIAEQGPATWDDGAIDRLVRSLFLADDASLDDNLQTVRASVAASPERRELLRLYLQVYNGRSMPVDERSVPQNHLRLIGLVTVDGGRLRVHNQIYREAFGAAWVRGNTPLNWPQLVTIGSVITILLIIVGTVLILRWQSQNAIARAEERVLSATMAPNRLFEMGRLCELSPVAARATFAQFSLDERRELFARPVVSSSPDSIRAVLPCLYSGDEANSPVLSDSPMHQSICRAMDQMNNADELRRQIGLDCVEH